MSWIVLPTSSQTDLVSNAAALVLASAACCADTKSWSLAVVASISTRRASEASSSSILNALIFSCVARIPCRRASFFSSACTEKEEVNEEARPLCPSRARDLMSASICRRVLCCCSANI